ncbi:SDR family oxidoreductase [Nocardia carnea]|uniref:SDR family oxidoreductase n=1 Tax=Nocardia carnea TaxID=37328 RepID=UPI002456ED67|nr:SDR family oxidoreductase [Nocardia carnea]
MTGILHDKVVVIAGVGPGLGRSIALRAAQAGADIILAARTPSKLDAVAREVLALGRRAVTVPTDLTDADAVAHLVDRTVEECGRVDALINNAYTQPSMANLVDTGYDHIRTGIELSVIGALRTSQLFTQALAESGGAIVMINSMVLRHSIPVYGTYKMAKSAMLAMSQSLASEIGPKGVRVNSVAPGYIWADAVKRHFRIVAAERGCSADEVYAQTAARMDLRRLPEPGEIADAVVFLASPMAAAITGQCLDVNCGEFHR